MDAAARATAYLHQIRQRRVFPSDDAIQALEQLVEPLPEAPSDPQAVLELLDRVASPATVANAGGRYFGFVNGGTLPASLAASWLAAAWAQNMGLRVLSPAAALLEDIALDWIGDLLHLPEGCGGGVVTGATVANFCCLAAARHALLEKAGWDVENAGLFHAPELKVVVGGEVHISLIKALGMLGLGRQRVHRVPVDGQGRMKASELPSLDDRTILCLQAGNVNTGAFDPADGICDKARASGAWVHVDGAFGLWAAASPRYRHLTEGFSGASSWAVDAHKWLNVGYDCGIAMVRDPGALRAAMTFSAPYVVTSEKRDPSQYTPEMSRRARGVELWAALRSLGRQGFAELIDRTCDHARHFAEALASHGFRILNDVVINQVLVSFGDPAFTRAVIDALQRDGTCWCGGTVWQGHTAMRISVSSWVTSSEDVDKSVAAILRAVKSIR